MSDSIDRLDTLKAIEDYFNPNHNTDELPASLMKFLVAVGVIISFQPSAQPERKKGYMKIKVISAVDGEGLFCENCDAYCLSPLYKFCPKCGIEFIGVRDEQDE